MNVHNAAAEQQRHACPRQDEAVTKVTQAQLLGILKDLFVVQSVDEGCGERCETREHLAEACDVEKPPFWHGEELPKENEEGYWWEDHREDH